MVVSMYIILVYDIAIEQDGAKVWRKTFKICKQYLHHIQNSVFEGEVTKAQLFQLESDIKKVIRSSLDSVIIFKTRQEKWLDKDMLGIMEDKTSNFL